MFGPSNYSIIYPAVRKSRMYALSQLPMLEMSSISFNVMPVLIRVHMPVNTYTKSYRPILSVARPKSDDLKGSFWYYQETDNLISDSVCILCYRVVRTIKGKM